MHIFLRSALEKQIKECDVADGLFFPTTVEEFRKQVVERDKFEWMNLSTNQDIYNSASTIIFVRDVYKNWCINGINANINTQEKLEDYLRQIVGNREVVTVGSSAGGYMAILFGILLKAKTIYSFSPQVNLHTYNIDHPIKYYEEYFCMRTFRVREHQICDSERRKLPQVLSESGCQTFR